VPSLSRPGDCWDNAVVESFFSTLKTELAIRRWPSHQAAMQALGLYINGFYNAVCLH
jgi:putative transposase